jgi:hypothetical protein
MNNPPPLFPLKTIQSKADRGMKFLAHVPLAGLVCGCLGLLIPSLVFPYSNTTLTEFRAPAPTTCPMCYQCPFCPITSTPSDLILTFAPHNSDDLRDLVVSIRSTGVRARVVVVVLEDTVISPHISDLIRLCGVELFRAHAADSSFAAYRQFLDSTPDEINRILHVNPEYTYFQGDPFTDSIVSDGIDVVLEGVTIGESPTAAALSRCYGAAALDRLSVYEVAGAGTFGGRREGFHRFVRALSNLSALECEMAGADQAHVNHLVWTTRWSDFDLPFAYHGCASGIVAAQHCIRSLLSPYRVFVGQTGREVAVLHEYGEMPAIVTYVHQLCSITIVNG